MITFLLCRKFLFVCSFVQLKSLEKFLSEVYHLSCLFHSECKLICIFTDYVYLLFLSYNVKKFKNKCQILLKRVETSVVIVFKSVLYHICAYIVTVYYL